MKIIAGPQRLQKELGLLRKKGKRVGFVPTMGALHVGHLELIRRAKRDNQITVVSIFVNPTQFGPREDFKRYPRPVDKDTALLRRAGVDYLLMPTVEDMYPQGDSLFVDIHSPAAVTAITELYCGKSRPGHYRGVLTVCAKLFNIVRPDRVYMGAKDYQQTVVIERLIQELHLGIELVRVPTVREKDGLALSSRNIYLSASERSRALMISKTLFQAGEALKRGKKNLKSILRSAQIQLARYVDQVDYLAAVDPETLLPLSASQRNMVLLAACYVGKTRLIDNVILSHKV
ncbi:MAG: pantoate--beta-alanine ligase [Candidatus Omnitrophica bacterium]|nr:pantoate--beta-alanine ligase [Candidatus Omnitrophota bacterium]